jgi:hypothetical protein
MRKEKIPLLARKLTYLNTHSREYHDGSTDIPLCIHAHTIALPLLADFPRSRIDINPFLESSKEFIEDFSWSTREIDIVEALRTARRKNKINRVAIFLDSYTIQNLNITNVTSLDAEIYLFLGDTQHGPHEGFHELIRIANNNNFTKVITSNNPQHLHFFKDSGINPSKLFYCPLGLANIDPRSLRNNFHEKHKSDNIASLLENRIIFAGTIGDTHPKRKRLLNTLSRLGYCNILRTTSYADSILLHRNALASINTSLNTDINFRFSEVLGSGGTLITDRLPYCQMQYIHQFFGTEDIYYYEGVNDLIEICKDLMEKQKDLAPSSSKSKEYLKIIRQTPLESFDNLDSFLIPFNDSGRENMQQCLFAEFADLKDSISFKARLDRYLYWRDQALALDAMDDQKVIRVNHLENPLTLIDITDLGFKNIIIESSSSQLRAAAKILNRHFQCELVVEN